MKEIIKQIKEEAFAIEEHAIFAQRAHMLNYDANLENYVDIIQDKAKLILSLVGELEKEIE